MGRTPIPLQVLAGKHLTKKEKEQRAKKEQRVNLGLKNDKLKTPTWLGREGKKMFRFIIEQYQDTEMLTNLDVNAVATYSDLHERKLQLLEEVRENGSTLVNVNSRGGKTYVQNPALTALNATIKLMQNYESKLGLTLLDRTKLVINAPEKPKEPTELEKRFGDRL